MAASVECHIGQARPRDRSAPSDGKAIRADRRAVIVAEHQSIRLGLSHAESHAKFELLLPVLRERRYGALRQRYDAATVFRFRGLKAQSGRSLFERVLDHDRGSPEIDILPTQGKQLAAPHSSGEGKGGDRMQARAFERVEHGGNLIGVEYLDLGGFDLRWRHCTSDIAGYHVELDCFRQSTVQNAIGTTDCASMKLADSADPETDLARALLAQGITGVVEIFDDSTGKPRSRVNIEAASKVTFREDRRRGPHRQPWRPFAPESAGVPATAAEVVGV